MLGAGAESGLGKGAKDRLDDHRGLQIEVLAQNVGVPLARQGATDGRHELGPAARFEAGKEGLQFLALFPALRGENARDDQGGVLLEFIFRAGEAAFGVAGQPAVLAGLRLEFRLKAGVGSGLGLLAVWATSDVRPIGVPYSGMEADIILNRNQPSAAQPNPWIQPLPVPQTVLS